ncbi:hypothetical protein [Roseivirga thermotolerans]|uniref:Uncharacterized protein n=1 Tax=Roseivirga thermotolerans TaxID=1758176 RepID=A0ABQ3I4T6_9BACT|nr:hypothetical protein [Roseivirga thermotolerans]GHE57803.1 hypothetical protein GCM10011340_11100 [Roseivirga thermotolerans]
MAKSKMKALSKKLKEKEKESKVKHYTADNDSLDFGGLPKDRDLKKNIGCGG